MAIPYIKNIKYKGFKPNDEKSIKEKVNIIKSINILIDKFKEDNNKLYETTIITSSQAANNAVEQEFGKSNRKYLVFYLQEIIVPDVINLNDASFNNREVEFQKIISSLTQNPNQNIRNIEKEISKWLKNEKQFIKKETKNINAGVKEIIKKTIKKIKVELSTKQERKKLQLIDKCDKLITIVEKELTGNNQNIKAQQIFNALKELKTTLLEKNGNLELKTLYALTDCFGKNRNWSKINPNEKIKYPPVPNCNAITNQVIINFYGMITDTGTNIEKIVQEYVKTK